MRTVARTSGNEQEKLSSARRTRTARALNIILHCKTKGIKVKRGEGGEIKHDSEEKLRKYNTPGVETRRLNAGCLRSVYIVYIRRLFFPVKL